MEAKLNLLLLLVVLVSLQGWWCDACWEEERFALLQIKSSAEFFPDILKSWIEGNPDCCRWERVVCNNTTGRVTKLDLDYANELFFRFSTMSAENWYLNASYILAFEDLESLYLRSYSLAGFVIDEGFGRRSSRLSKLMVLDLSENNLTDTNNIFQFLSGLSSLRFLNLAYNRLTGSIHYTGFEKLSSRLTKLEVVDLAYNDLDDNIFLYLSGFSSLKSLNLSGNGLTGSISHNGFERQSSKLNKLIFLDLSRNKLNESNATCQFLSGLYSLKYLNLGYSQLRRPILSTEILNLTSLESLILGSNPLEKSFLQSLGALSNSLKFLSLSSSLGKLRNSYGEGLCNLKKLEELDLSQNSLQGQVPSCFRNMTSLQLLDLSDNLFNGNISSSPLPHLTSLVFLQLSGNNFQVPVSFNSFANNSNLKVILCDENELVPETSFQTFPPKFQLTTFTLRNCRLGGLHLTLPSFLYHQNDLRSIVLSDTNVGGNIPSWLLKNNTRMEMLVLRNNSFIGSFPQLSNPYPQTLLIDLSNNKLRGHISTNINLTFPNLKFLILSSNDFDGNIPHGLNYMTSLRYLDLSHNKFYGGIPEQITSAPECVKLSYNSLDGQIPSALFNYSLDYLYLDGNKFVGKLPDISYNMNVSIEILDAGDNILSGELPRWIANMSGLMGIDLSNNLFKGSIPLEFCQLDNLQFLYLSENNLSGSIPSCFSSSNLRHVHLSKNSIGGGMTNAFNGSFDLVTLDLSHNDLTGTIPSWLGNLSALSILLLSGNHFQGDASIPLCHMDKLSLLDLSHNELSGSIPSCLSNLTFTESYEKSWSTFSKRYFPPPHWYDNYEERFKYLQKSYIDLILDEHRYYVNDVPHTVKFTTKKLSLTYGGSILDFMSGIDLSSNQFTGEIPKELGNLSEIYALNLSHNNLTGSIPSTFSNLKQIESLDLSYNKLSGKIPYQLIELSTLEVFSVAYNKLSGAIPEMKDQFGTFDESSYEGNTLLCGPPLNKSCSEIEPPSPSQYPSEESEGFIDMKVFYVSFLVVYTSVLLGIIAVLYINPYWRRTWFNFIESCITL